MNHLIRAIVVLASSLAASGCVHFPFHHVADCAVEEGKDVYRDLFPLVIRVLASPDPATIERELANLIAAHGKDLIVCIVTRVGSGTVTATPDSARVHENAQRWLREHR